MEPEVDERTVEEGEASSSLQLASGLPALSQGRSSVTGVDYTPQLFTCSLLKVHLLTPSSGDPPGHCHLQRQTSPQSNTQYVLQVSFDLKLVKSQGETRELEGPQIKVAALLEQCPPIVSVICNRFHRLVLIEDARSSSLKMQQPNCNYPLEKNNDTAEKEGHLNVETEPQCGPENNSHNTTQKLSATGPLRCTEQMEATYTKGQPQSCQDSPQSSPRSLSKKHYENQGNLLHFDRQAPGRISTSPTLRRLRGNGNETQRALSQRETLEASTWKESPGSPCYFSSSVPGIPKESSQFQSTQRLLPLDAERTLNVADSVVPQVRPNDEQKLPNLHAVDTQPLPHAPCPGRQSPSWPSLIAKTPGPQSTEFCCDFLGQEMTATCGHGFHFELSNTWPGGLINILSVIGFVRFYEHRRSSVVLNLPGLEVFPGDLLVSDGAANYLCHPLLLLNSESKKSRWPFSRKDVGKDKHKHLADLETCLSSLKITDFRSFEFFGLKDKSWNEVMETHGKPPTDQLDLRKQQEAMWELFTSECTYFLDHLLVMKMIFMNTLKYLHTRDYLLDVDLWRLFANLEELSQTSFGFVTSLFGIIKDYFDTSETSPLVDFASVLTKYFQGSLCQSHQTYCLNYSAAVFYLESLRQREDFGIYLKWCEQNEQCRRLHLPELLVAPLHRLTRYPLLLKNIWKRSTDSTEKIMVYSIKEKVEKSIRDLEGKVKWLDNFQKCRHLQEIIVWPPLWERDKRFFIPECLKHVFKEYMAENILSPTNRHLLYEGKLTLAENTRFLDVYLFLFDDFLLVTKTKRNKKKTGGLDLSSMCPSLTPELLTVIKEGGSCTVLDQPIPLDRLVLRSIDPLHVSVFGLRNAFLVQHENRYRQCIAAFLLQAQTENIKKIWMTQISEAISCFFKNKEMKKISFFTLPAESSEI
ncbi:pleckstrin homology domain-containing family G member 7 [Sorex araneus]|uniref:pleckstrin homology domain-containing family G member 7 n=1 Tax=Sorex araneus TaxID=42254 RepID=UPI002433C739|nr:pleckstrin homology domain-containing family G member 7 [Sorex araneus]